MAIIEIMLMVSYCIWLFQAARLDFKVKYLSLVNVIVGSIIAIIIIFIRFSITYKALVLLLITLVLGAIFRKYLGSADIVLLSHACILFTDNYIVLLLLTSSIGLIFQLAHRDKHSEIPFYPCFTFALIPYLLKEVIQYVELVI